MKISVLFFCLSTLSVVAAGPSKPELFLNINSDSLDKGLGLGVLEPTVKWQTSGSVAKCDVEVRLTYYYILEHLSK